MLSKNVKPCWLLVLFMGIVLSSIAQAATLGVNSDGTADHLTIQQAIDAAVDGDMIQIASGHYVEQLIIENKLNVAFVGAGEGITFIDSPDVLLQSVDVIGYPQYPVVIISDSDGINFSDLTLDGRGKGVGNQPFHGFGYFDSGGTIKDVHLTGLREDPLSSQLHGNGMYVVTLAGGSHEMTFTNVLVDDFQKTGILLHGTGLTATANNVTVLGQGPIPAPVQNGWQVSGGAQLTANNCTTSDLSNFNSVYVATGMLGLADTKLIITDCDFDSCDVGLYAIANTTTYTGGTILNPVLNGIMGKSYSAKTQMDEMPAQPIVVGEDFEKASGSLDILLSDLILIGNDLVTSWGVAVLSDNLITVDIDNLQISHFGIGLIAYEGVGVVEGIARNSTFFDNFYFGAMSLTALPFDARYNDWGHPSGPYHETINPLGQGDWAFENVNFTPFNGGASLVLTPQTAGPVPCGEPVLYTVTYVAGPTTPDLFLYNIPVRGGTGLNTPSSPVSSNPWGGTELFLHYDNGDFSYTVTGSTVGGSPQPLVGPGSWDLFTIEVSAAVDSGGYVLLDGVTLRDPLNNTIPTTVSVSHLFADCQGPAAVTNITADPHHNRIAVSWNHDGTDVDHYEVFTGLWHDGSHVSVYPEYDDVLGNTVPTRPSNYSDAVVNPLGEWLPMGNVNALTVDQNWSDSSKRGIYYYEVFAVDAVGNSSPVALDNDLATNYWLGDAAGLDGFVGVSDLTTLGASFGEVDGSGLYNNHCDYGPTDDSSRLGIPETDDVVDFEDLIIISMNYGVVSNTNKTEDNISGTASLRWIEAGDGQYALRLIDGQGIKAIRVKANLPAGSCYVTAGQLLDSQDELTFLKNVGTGLDVSVAVMGTGNGFEGTGDLFIVKTAQAIDASSLDITVRGHDNSDLLVSLDELSGSLTPRVFALKANYPNPFNPQTKISFSLPEEQSVRLTVFGIDGSKVATLVNEVRSSGLHEVIWNGRDDQEQSVASGTYFYRIEAGPYQQVRKMTLMK